MTESTEAAESTSNDSNQFKNQEPTYNQGSFEPPVVQKASTGKRTFLFGFAGAALACIIALGGFAAYQSFFGSSGGKITQLGAASSTAIDAEDEDASLAEAVASKAMPSVAAIDVYSKQGVSYGFSQQSTDTLEQSSLGSGVVLSEDGYIVTNNHVIEGADALSVSVAGETYKAEVVGSDASSDIAVIKAIDAKELTPIELGDSDKLTIGEWVMSIGSPFGLEQSVATGIVSATSRSQILDSTSEGSSGEAVIYPNMIQTDAAINPGNSGGALVDADGKLIGLNTLITSYSGNYSGVGFAIPVNYAATIAQQIIEGKTPTHAQLGVSLSTVNAQIAQHYGLPVESGAYIAAVSEGSGADEAGLQAGDIVTKCDNQAVESASDLMLDVRSKNPGDKITLEVNRDGKTKQVEVTLGSDESSTKQSSVGSKESSIERLLQGGKSSKNAA